MTNNLTNLDSTNFDLDEVDSIAPHKIRILEEIAKSKKIAYKEFPEAVRESLDEMAMSLLDNHAGRLMIIGYERVGKSFLIEQLAFNKSVFIEKTGRDNLTFIVINESELRSIDKTFESWADYLGYVESITGATEETICFVTSDAYVAKELSEISINSKIILETSINTISNLLASEFEGETNMWTSWDAHDANFVYMKKPELIKMLNASILPLVIESYGNILNEKKIENFVNIILQEVPITVQDKVIYAPAGLFAFMIRRLAGYLALGSASDLVSSKGSPTFAKTSKKVIMEFMNVFDSFLGNSNGMGFANSISEADAPIEGGRQTLHITQDDIEKLIEIKKERERIERGEPSQDDNFAFSDMSTLADRLKKEVIGQDDAINKVVGNMIIPAAGLNDPEKPITSLLLLGPTGVGKTKIAQTLAKELMNKELNFVRLDMSEYAEKHTANRLFGSPSGYIGHDKGGELTNAIMDKPHSVILLDEVEKAHPLIWDSFLQVFDAGRMTSGKGETVDFSKSIIIMTSNLGAREVSKKNMGFAGGTLMNKASNYIDSKSTVMQAVEDYFKPEMLNRIDEIVLLNSLDMDTAKLIVQKELNIVFSRANSAGYTINEPNSDIIDVLLEKADINKYGAREIQRIIKNNLSAVLASAMLDENRKSDMIDFAISEENKIIVTYEN